MPLQIGSKLEFWLLNIGMTRFGALYVYVKWTIDFPFRSVNRSAGEDLLEQRASITCYKEASEMQKGFFCSSNIMKIRQAQNIFFELVQSLPFGFELMKFATCKPVANLFERAVSCLDWCLLTTLHGIWRTIIVNFIDTSLSTK